MRLGYPVGLVFLVAVLSSICAPVRAQAPIPPVSVCTISNDRPKYDKKVLVVNGIITSFRKAVSGSGNPYWTLQLKDATGNCFVRLYMRRHPGPLLVQGQNVNLLGAYFREYKFGRWSFKHEIHPTAMFSGTCNYWLTNYGWAGHC